MIIYLICIVNGELQISVPVQLQLHVHAKFQTPAQCTKEKFCPSNLMTVQNTEIVYLYFDIKLIVKYICNFRQFAVRERYSSTLNSIELKH